MMGKIPEHILQEIKDRVSIIEVVGDYVRLQKDGANYKGLCPFHQEKTPSFKVHEGKGIYKCFGCGEAGNVFKFLMKLEGMSFMEAAEKLASRAGISLPREEPKPEDVQKERNQSRLFLANELAAKFFHETLLQSGEAKGAREYLETRGFRAETIARFLLGYSPSGWENTLTALKARGLRPEEIHGAGLGIARDDGGYYDRFRGRLMFPIHDVQGRVRGFGARILKDEPDQPKYINTPETEIFKKGLGFYGLYQAKEEIRKRGKVLVVEGYFDQIALDQAGVKYAVATLGTALTPEHARLLRRYTREVFLIFDADAAGQKAALRSLEPFLEAGLSPRIALIPQGKDPDEFLRSHSAADFEKLLESAPPLVAHSMDLTIAEAGPTPAGLSRAISQATELLSKIYDPIERNAFAERLARRTGAPLSQVQARLRRPEKKKAPSESAPPTAEPWTAAYPPAEVELLRLLIHHPETAAAIRESAAVPSLRDPDLAGLIQALLEQEKQTGRMDPGTLLTENFHEGLSDLVSRVIFERDPFKEKAREVVKDVTSRVFRGELEARLVKVRQEIEDAQGQGDEGRWRELLEKQQTLLAEQRTLFSGKCG